MANNEAMNLTLVKALLRVRTVGSALQFIEYSCVSMLLGHAVAAEESAPHGAADRAH